MPVKDGQQQTSSSGQSSNSGQAGTPVPLARKEIALTRTSYAEKDACIARLADFHARHAATSDAALQALQKAALEGENMFAALMEAVQHCSLGQITHALYEVGGEYRRNI